MGCDIHVMTEVKITKDSPWEFFGEIHMDRWYDLFSKMVDIVGRGNEEAIADQRGIPEDASALTKYLIDDVDFHTHSYLNHHELAMIVEYIGNFDFSADYASFIEFSLNYYGYNFFDRRIVFAFDN